MSQIPTAAAKTKTISLHDVVQITDQTHPWYPALLVVTDLKPWGVQCYGHVIDSNLEQNQGQAFNRLRYEQIERIGKAKITLA